jgi:hypothetical protein
MSRDQHDQKARFEQTARELGVEMDEAKLREALRRITSEKPEPKRPTDK